MSAFTEYLAEHPEIRLNEEQLAAVMSDENTVVSAGAGSGKTHVLSYRFLRLVMDGKAHSDEILTLTFTRKAAGEMAERIYKRLVDAIDVIGKEEIERYGEASVSTLDSFCAEIVRSDSVRYGISRDFATIDSSEPEAESIIARLADEFLTDTENREESRVLASVYSPDSVYTDFFQVLFSRSVLTGDYTAAEVSALLEEIVEGLIRSNEEVLLSGHSFLADAGLTSKALEIFSSNKEALERNDYAALAVIPRRMKDPEVKEYLLETYNPAVENLVAAASARESAEDSRLLQSAVEKFISLVKKEKRRSGMLTYSDVSAMAISILRDNKDIRGYYKSRFGSIMIDEFQDNNSEQRDLLYLLSERKDRCSDGIPTAAELEKGKLFFVGDEKQSIYRFRGADVSVFRSLQEELVSVGGAALKLSVNYRSNPALIRLFNTLFKEVFSDSEEAYKARYEESLAGKEEAISRCEIALFDRDSKLEGGLDSAECEAEFIAEKIRTIVSSDAYLLPDGRRPEYKDIAILLRNGGNQMNFERSLKNRSIPYQLAESRSLMIEAVASDFYNLFQSIVYPEDRLALASLLRSPFARISDGGIHLIMTECGGDLSSAADKVEGEDVRRLAAFTSFYREVKQRAFAEPLTSLLEFAYISGGYASFLSENPAYRSYLEHYDYLFAMARSYEESGLSLTDYLRLLRKYLGSGGKAGEVTVLHEEKEGVQIMTVHKSKGLEFPVVIVADLGNTGRRDVNTNLFEYKGQLIASKEKSICSFLDEERREMEDAELRRVLYVALTRAECHLLLSGCYCTTAKGELNRAYTGPVLRMLLEAAGYDIESDSFGSWLFAYEKIAPCEDYVYDTKDGRSADVSALRAEFEAYQPKSLSDRVHRIAVTALEEEGSGEITRLATFPEDSLLEKSGAYDRFGTCTHAILERLVQGQEASSYTYSIVPDDKDNEILMAFSRRLADNFISSELFRRIRDKEKKCELRFYSYLPELDCTLEGVCDLVVFLEDCTLVIDYKTDSTRQAGSHERQIISYIEVLESIYQKPCYGSIFYLRGKSEEGFIDRDGNPVSL